jgi:hypothetical protein
MGTLQATRQSENKPHTGVDEGWFCDDGNESLGYIKGKEFLLYLSNCQLLEKESDLLD